MDELRLGGSVDPKLLTGVKEFQAAIRALDLLYKQNKISADDLKKSASELGSRIKDSNVDWTKQVTLMTSLHHVQERADVGFKSMSRTLKEMYAEERVQNRTLSEMNQTLSSLSGVIGGDTGKQAGTLISNFQGLEFALQASGRALQTMGGSASALGGFLGKIAGPAALVGGAILLIQQNAEAAATRIATLRSELAKLRGESGIKEAKEAYDKAAAGVGATGGPLGMAMLGAEAIGTLSTDPATRKLQEQLLTKDVAYENYIQALAKNAPNTGLPEDVYKSGMESLKATGKTPKEHDYTLDMMRTRLGDRPGRLSGLGMGVQPGAAFKGKVGVGAAPTPDVMFTEAESRFMAFQTSFQSGISAMSSTLSGTLGGAFASVFGGARTLLGSFASAFASTMAELASRWVFGKLFGSLLNLIPGIGPALSVTGTTLADTRGVGPSSVGGGDSPMLAKIENAINSLELRVDNVGLYMGTERGRVAYNNR